MKIKRIETFIVHTPVTRSGIADSTHQITHWGAPGVILETDTGLRGYGFSGTHAHLPTDRLIVDCIEHSYGPLLLGADPTETQHLWQKLHKHSPVMWVGRGGITHLALGAIDIALWDLKAKAAGQPLWQLLGGSAEKRVQGYNTDGGWLNWTQEQLVTDCRRMVEVDGYEGVKIKLGRPHLGEDLARIEAVRQAIGPNVKLMVDANGRFDLPTAIQLGRRLSDYDVAWFEEPIWYDDVPGHRALAQAIQTPIALGEQLYSLDPFRDFISAGAVHYVQPDAVRVAGVTEWWQVADLAHAFRLPVAPHVGDMAQLHLQLAIAHPACHLLEFIPWLQPAMAEPVTVRGGYFVTPDAPGAGTTLAADALERFGRKKSG